MSIKKQKILTFCLFLSLLTNAHYSYATSEKRDQQNEDSTNEENSKKKIPPLPRHVLLPKVTYSRAPDIEGEYTLDFSKHKFWFIAMLASWNERSTDITKIFNSNMKEFNKRNIGVLGLFSQNTDKDVEKWRKKNNPLFENYFASRNLVDSLKNPKIPVVWLVGDKGEILLKLELPTIQQIDASVVQSFILSSF